MNNINFWLLFSFLLVGKMAYGQVYMELPSMPESVSNNAVTHGKIKGVPHLYSFSGIDSTKAFSGIHKKGFRYNTQTQIWDRINDLPSGNGRIAAGASTVKNKIYIIGGYEVMPNGSEISFDKVHIYDPETNEYLADGAPIPVPIDDHVQAVYNDSLIFVVTGWTTSGHVDNVQIYDPANDVWTVGTPVPSALDYEAFGASGSIIGDTLYYAGGARAGSSFPATTFIRKGYIDRNDPTNIEWSGSSGVPATKCYRSAAFSNGREMYWIGGSDVTYNFDGIAYNGSGGVNPRLQATYFAPTEQNVPVFSNDDFPPVMDLRGIGLFEGNAAFTARTGIIAGGMLENQEVTNKVYEIRFPILINNHNLELINLSITPNPAGQFFIVDKDGKFSINLIDAYGRVVLSKVCNGHEPIDVSMMHSGNYFVQVFSENTLIAVQNLILR